MRTRKEIINEFTKEDKITRGESMYLMAQYAEQFIDLIEECFVQACAFRVEGTNEYKYDHLCISTYQDAQRLLIELGRIKQSDCYRK